MVGTSAGRTDDERRPLLPKSASEQVFSFGARAQQQQSLKGNVGNRLANKGKAKEEEKDAPKAILSVFGDQHKVFTVGRTAEVVQTAGASTNGTSSNGALSAEKVKLRLARRREFDQQIEAAKQAIEDGLQPKMIGLGSSGSYFVKARFPPATKEISTVAVFKPQDEEPYGALNPKRKFLRKYFSWAMGRPCLIPNFSYLSEVGASYLNDRLDLNMVPPTTLVTLSSPSFYYHYHDRVAHHKEGKPLPDKVGSFQQFLHGFVNMSDFLRQHPWPSRPKSMTEVDLAAEHEAHRRARKESKARLRKCYIGLKHFVLCRQSVQLDDGDDEEEQEVDVEAQRPARRSQRANEMPREMDNAHFAWTPSLMESFHLELEKLVLLDYLMRNTDRGLDNAMVKVLGSSSEQTLKIGAIDSSLSFPHKHPGGIREYPYGWLWLPSDLIGRPWSQGIREHMTRVLADPAWWHETEQGLQRIFAQDRFFSPKMFARQMALVKGQAWNILHSLASPEEGEGGKPCACEPGIGIAIHRADLFLPTTGPLELVARPKKLVETEKVTLRLSELAQEDREHSVVVLDPVLLPSLQKPAAVTGPAAPLAMTASSSSHSPSPNPSLPVGAEPRSLPSMHHGAMTSIATRMGLEHRSSLGIEVVKELEGAARKANKSGAREAFGGFALSRTRSRDSIRSLSQSLHEASPAEAPAAQSGSQPIPDLAASVPSLPSRASARPSRPRSSSTMSLWSFSFRFPASSAQEAKVVVLREVSRRNAQATTIACTLIAPPRRHKSASRRGPLKSASRLVLSHFLACHHVISALL